MGANVDASEFAKKLPNLVRDLQRNRMGRSINQPVQNVAGSKEIQLANLNKLSGAPQQNGK
jgi:hypothetical protein